MKLNKDGTAGSVAWGGYGEVGDAIAVLVDPTRETISERMGVEHKVRNFFNNIIDPSNEVDVTIDTHAVAAALLQALGQSQPEVKHNFGGNKLGQPGPGKDGVAGISGTYAIFADAYREAAAWSWGSCPASFRASRGKRFAGCSRLTIGGMRRTEIRSTPSGAVIEAAP